MIWCDAERNRPLCPCSALTGSEMLAAVRDRHLYSIEAVMQVLNVSGRGCAVCRPALQYFVAMSWPAESCAEGSPGSLENPGGGAKRGSKSITFLSSFTEDIGLCRKLAAMAPRLDNLWMPVPVRITIRNAGPERDDLFGADIGLFRRNSKWALNLRSCESVIRPSIRVADAECENQAWERLTALLQLFREEARHNESLEAWRRRFGTVAIQHAVAGEWFRRSGLAGRFRNALAHHLPPEVTASGPVEVVDSEDSELLMPAAASG